MKLISTMKASLLGVFLALAVVACDDEPGNHGTDADARTQTDGASPYVCDPVGASPEVGGLLNAELAADVEVIVKEPQHPGDPGPDNLP